MTRRGGTPAGRVVTRIALVGAGIGLLVWIVIRPAPPPAERPVAARADPRAASSEAAPARARAPVPAPAPTVTAPAAPAAAPPVVPAPRGAPGGEGGDESAAMARIRASVRTDPDGALTLLEETDRAHPDGPLAEERAALRVDALVFAQRIGLARDAAEEYLRRYPQGDRAQHIEMLTGVHPRPPDE
jgi:hypothetical protein